MTEYRPDRNAESFPQSLGRYRVVSRLGFGLLGPVYRARDDELRREIAIKCPRRDWLPTPRHQQAWLEQTRRIAALDGAGFVPLYDSGSTGDGGIYLVMKLVAGGSLADRLAEHRMSPARSVRVVIHAARGLQLVHQAGLVHGNIKPANMLLESESEVRLTDPAPAGGFLGEVPAGTVPWPVYLSPEQLGGETHRVDGRTDIYSLGLVLFELLSGTSPFSTSTWAQRQARAWLDEVPSLLESGENVPAELARICLRAASRRVSDRYTSAQEFADELTACLERLTDSDVESPASSGHSGPGPVRGHQPEVAGRLRTGGMDETGVPIVVPKGLRSFDREDAEFFVSLLPGPFGRDGLPESLRFWIARIGERDPQATFALGLMYGPSGCGKSSLLKAGVIPRLDPRVTSIYLEATPDGTEARLLATLRRRLPGMPGGLSLTEALSWIRRGGGAASGGKVVLFLDQFEQWLHANREVERPELVTALRQCDGARLQCVILVRDDFWMAITRFMHDLEVSLIEGVNSAAVDLFTPQHAQKVLVAFGRAYGALPDRDDQLKPAEREFLKEAVAGLTADGKVVSVQLSLFADMVRNKPWTPATLREVGGTAGIGVAFLDETFSGPHAPPEHRRHQRAARAVLKQLLPEGRADIKGRMHERARLLEASGYAAQPAEFDELIRLLDSQLRLVTPADPEAETDNGAESAQAGRFFQLTHDYLVPAIRRWLVRKQQQTPRGRAELLLAELASTWSARRESRHLPGLWQWLRIRGLTSALDWSGAERQVMRAADRHHLFRGAMLALFTGLCLLAGHTFLQAMRAHAWRDRLLYASTAEVPEILPEMQPFRRWLIPLLRQVIASRAPDSREVLHARMALLSEDPGQFDPLLERALGADDASLPALAETLAAQRDETSSRLWDLTDKPAVSAERRLRAALILARQTAVTDETERERWRSAAPRLGRLIADAAIADPARYRVLVEGFRPVAPLLVEPMHRIWSELPPDDAARSILANLLVEYADDRAGVLTDLLLEAGSSEQQLAIADKLARHRDEALARIEPELQQRGGAVPRLWHDAPLDSESAVTADIVRSIEEAHGLVTARFAFCQTLPIEEFAALDERLRSSGFAPAHCRPYLDGDRLKVAAVWNRNGRTGQVEFELDDAALARLIQSDRLRQERLVELATYGTPAGERRHAAVWQSRRPGDPESRAYFTVEYEDWVSSLSQQSEQGFAVSSVDFQTLDGEGLFSVVAVFEKREIDEFVELASPAMYERQLSDRPAGRLQTAVDLAAIPTRDFAALRRAWARSLVDQNARVVGRQPNNVIAWYDLGWNSLLLGENERAIEVFTRVIERWSPAEELWRLRNAHMFRSIAAARLGRAEQAEKFLDQAVANDSDEYLDRLRRVYTMVAAGQVEEGLDRLKKELEVARHAWKVRDVGLGYAFAAGEIRHDDPVRAAGYLELAQRFLAEAASAGENFTWQYGEIWTAVVADDPGIQRMHLDAVDSELPAIKVARRGAAELALAELSAFLDRTTDQYQRLWVETLVLTCLGREDEAAAKIEAELAEKPDDVDLGFWGGALSYGRMVGEISERVPEKARKFADRAVALIRNRAAKLQGPTLQVFRRELQTLRELIPLFQDPALLACMDELDRQYSAVIESNSELESRELHGLNPAEHLDQARLLAAEGWRMVALDACRVPSQAQPVTVSVWHRPRTRDRDRERFVNRKVAAALLAVRLGRLDLVWPLLGDRGDLELRTALTGRLGRFFTDLAQLLEQLSQASEAPVRRALVLALGEIRAEALPVADRDAAVSLLLDLYRKDPDPGIHGAAEWVLRRWNQREKLDEAGRELARRGARENSHWRVSPQRQTLVRVPGPVETDIGSAVGEPGQMPQERRHRRRIARSFELATKELTVAQFDEFLKEHPQPDYRHDTAVRPDPQCPVSDVTWYAAARYCRWLSEQEGVPEDEMVFPPVAEIRPGMVLPSYALARTGFRIPTEAEWEWACRAGTATPWSFGSLSNRLESFGWIRSNSAKRTWPVGLLPPNDLGLFDCYGNVGELCSGYLAYPQPGETGIPEDGHFSFHPARELSERGGGFISESLQARSASRINLGRSSYDSAFAHLGFRLARTVLPAEWLQIRVLKRTALASAERENEADFVRAHERTCAAFEELLTRQPQNHDLAWEFAEYLLAAGTRWIVLRPEPLVAEGNATLERLSDDWARAKVPVGAEGSLVFETEAAPGKLAGLRLEFRPDSEVTAPGPDRAPAETLTFHLPEVSLIHADGRETAIPLRQTLTTGKVIESFETGEVTVQLAAGSQHETVWETLSPVAIPEPSRLGWRFKLGPTGQPSGRFRISATRVPQADGIEQWKLNLDRSSLNGWARLACARMAQKETSHAAEALSRAGAKPEGAELADLFVLSRLCWELGQPGTARVWLHRGLGRWDSQLADPQLRRMAARAMSAAIDASPNDLGLLTQQARLLLEADEVEAARLFVPSSELSTSDPARLIARARMYLEAGDAARSEADFRRAAELSQDELDRFLQSGWWTVGPYPAGLAQEFPPEHDPHPLRAVTAAQGNAELRWKPVASQSLGLVDLRPIYRANDVSAYLLNYVYVAHKRTATLLVGGDDGVRVWLNGTLIHDRADANGEILLLERIPVTLQAGRNTLLVKVSNWNGNHLLRLRFDDSPVDRGLRFAELGLWNEAAPLFRRAFRAPGALGIDNWPELVCGVTLAAAGDGEGYREHCARLLSRFAGNAQPGAVESLALLCSLVPEGQADPGQFAKFVDIASGNQNPSGSQDFHRAWALYRAGRVESALVLLDGNPEVSGWPRAWLLRALCQFSLGDQEAARGSYQRAIDWYTAKLESAVMAPHTTPFWGHWWEFGQFEILLREAAAALGPLPEAVRDARALFADKARESLQQLSDRALVACEERVHAAPEDPRAWKARAKRYRELGLIEHAAADEFRVLELNPYDEVTRYELLQSIGQLPEPAEFIARLAARSARSSSEAQRTLRRGKLWALLGEFDRAIPETSSGLDALPDERFWVNERCVAVRDLAEVNRYLTLLLEARPDDLHLRVTMARLAFLARHWKYGLDLLRPVIDECGNLEWCDFAEALLMLGDHEGYREFIAERVQRAGESAALGDATALGRAASLSPHPAVDRARPLSWLERAARIDSVPWVQNYYGLALLRAGRFDDAVRVFEQSLGRGEWAPREHAQNELGIAVARANQKRWSEAQRWYESALQHVPADNRMMWAVDWGELCLLRREAQRLLVEHEIDELSAQLEGQPSESGRLLPERARRYEGLRRWPEAAADWERLANDNPRDPSGLQGLIGVQVMQRHWSGLSSTLRRLLDLRGDTEQELDSLRLAVALAAGNDIDGYHQWCETLVARHRATTNPHIADRIARGALIVPPRSPVLEEALRLAELAVASGPDDPAFSSHLLTRALAAYRSGDYSGASDWAEKCLADTMGKSRETRLCIARLVQAMARQQLGNPTGAQAAFEQAHEIREPWLRLAESGEETFDDGWHDWVIAELLFHEAGELIGERESP